MVQLPVFNFEGVLPMWHKYRVELFPEFGNNQIFPAAFRRSRRNGSPGGIIKIKSPSNGGTQ